MRYLESHRNLTNSVLEFKTTLLDSLKLKCTEHLNFLKSKKKHFEGYVTNKINNTLHA